MSTNVLLTPSIITKEALVILENNLVAAKKVTREYERLFGKNLPTSGKIGDTLNVRLPNRFTVRTNSTLAAQDISEKSVPIVVDKIAGVDFSFTSKELSLNIDEFSDRYLKPAMATIANKIDFDVLQNYKSVYNQVGTPRVTPATFAALAATSRRLNEEAAPRDAERHGIFDPAAEVALADAFKTFFNPQAAISSQYKDAEIGRVAGVGWNMDQNVALHTTGSTSNTTPAVLAYVAGATTISIDGLNGATVTLKKGDTFTIAGVFAVNPQSRQSTGVLRQIVVTADTTAVGSAMPTLPISPALYASGPFQNVTVLPVDNDLITLFDPSTATSTQNLVFHKDAFALVTVPLELPNGVHFAARETYKGISMRIVRQYTISDDAIPTRIDVLYGTSTLYPQLAVRLAG